MAGYLSLTLVFVLFCLSVKPVPDGRLYTIERFGRFHRTLRPGINLVLPLFDRIGRITLVQDRVLDLPSMPVTTAHDDLLRVSGMVRYQIVDFAKIAREIDSLEHALANLVADHIRHLAAMTDAKAWVSHRDAIEAALTEDIGQITAHKGVEVKKITILASAR